MPATSPDDAIHSRLLSIAEVADMLGVDVRHVRRLVFDRRIPYIKWGHLLRFDPAEISAWIDAYRHHPITQRSGRRTIGAIRSTDLKS